MDLFLAQKEFGNLVDDWWTRDLLLVMERAAEVAIYMECMKKMHIYIYTYECTYIYIYMGRKMFCRTCRIKKTWKMIGEMKERRRVREKKAITSVVVTLPHPRVLELRSTPMHDWRYSCSRWSYCDWMRLPNTTTKQKKTKQKKTWWIIAINSDVTWTNGWKVDQWKTARWISKKNNQVIMRLEKIKKIIIIKLTKWLWWVRAAGALWLSTNYRRPCWANRATPAGVRSVFSALLPGVNWSPVATLERMMSLIWEIFPIFRKLCNRFRFL